MRLVTGLIPAGGLLAALRTLGGALRHSPAVQHTAAAASWAGNHAAAVATGGAATVVLTAALVVPAVTMHPATGAHYAAGGIPAPAASIWAASLIPAPSSSLPPSVHPNANADAKVAGQLGVIPLAPWSPLPSSPPPAVAPTPTPSAGQLALSSVTADLSSGQQVTITLYAVGGPVTWHAWCTGPDVTLSGGSGTSAPGVPSLLVFSAAPAQDGAAMARCHVWPGELRGQRSYCRSRRPRRRRLPLRLRLRSLIRRRRTRRRPSPASLVTLTPSARAAQRSSQRTLPP